MRNAFALLGVMLILPGCFLVPSDNTQVSNGARRAYPLMATSIYAGGNTSCALDQNSELWCWGDNASQKISTSPESYFIFPQKVVRYSYVSGFGNKTFQKFSQIAMNDSKICGIENDTKYLLCWGAWDPVYGYNYGDYVVLNNSTGYPYTFSKIALGQGFGCGIAASGTDVYCFGVDPMGRNFSSGNYNDANPINFSTDAGLPVTDLQVAGRNACALLNAGTAQKLYCWGANGYQQVSDSTTASAIGPSLIFPAGSTLITRFVLTAARLCYQTTTASGTLQWWCRGASYKGALAYSSVATTAKFPLADIATIDTSQIWGDLDSVTLVNTTYKVSARMGLDTSTTPNVEQFLTMPWGCRVTNGAVFCYGFLSSNSDTAANATGRTPTSLAWAQISASQIYGSNKQVKSLALGDDHGCILTVGGYVHCWGKNLKGQLGDGTFADHSGLEPVVLQ